MTVAGIVERGDGGLVGRIRKIASNARRAPGSVSGMEHGDQVGRRTARGDFTGLQAARVLAIAGAGDEPGAIRGREVAGNVARRAGGSVTVAILIAGGMALGESAGIPPNGAGRGGSVPSHSGAAATMAGRALMKQHPAETEPLEMFTKIQGAGAFVVAATIATQVQAQATAVQWRVEDGGNGHWYQKFGPYSSWQQAKTDAVARGGHLMTITSQSEWNFAWANIPPQQYGGTVLGGYQLPGSAEPGQWVWVTGEAWPSFINFAAFDDCPGGPSGSCGSTCSLPNQQDFLYYGWFGGTNPNQWFDDCGGDFNNDCGANPRYSIVEWDADCNNDGIIDFGQCRSGLVPDVNSNNIPDCCEQSIPCTDCYRYDLNPTGTVDGSDLGALLAFWGPVSPAFPRADINRDGVVNGEDLGLLLANWGPCR